VTPRSEHEADLARRLGSLFSLGKVAEVDHEAGRAKVHIAGNTTDWLPWLALRAGSAGDWWPPIEGEQVAVIAANGELRQGVILGSLFRADDASAAGKAKLRRTRFADGAELEYDEAAHRLSATLPAGAVVVIDTPGGLTLKGDLTVQGSVSASGDVADAAGSLASHRQVYAAHVHPTPSGLSGPPQGAV
jgi:phage baseplate assembly protein V